MDRVYRYALEHHLANHGQMLFMAGPCQAGKTTIAKMARACTDRFLYLNFDNDKHRKIIMSGEDAILNEIGIQNISQSKPILALDEIHKYRHWKQFLKGFYDLHKSRIRVVVTGSAKLNIYKASSDSLMGRYLLYRIHPLSVAEIIGRAPGNRLIQHPCEMAVERLETLYQLGGYPEPYLKNDSRFHTQWKRLRSQQLFREDIRDLSQIQDIPHLEMLAELLRDQSGQLANLNSLAKTIRVSHDTVNRWINTLESFYYCFRIKPWHKNVARSIRKEAKFYLWDWSGITDPGARFENFIACHLLKAIQFWNDEGHGDFELRYVRDTYKREVDFVVIRNNKPWFLVESKLSNNQHISKNLYHFHKELSTEHAFQLSLNEPFVDVDCFSYDDPVIAPVITFLSQLV